MRTRTPLFLITAIGLLFTINACKEVATEDPKNQNKSEQVEDEKEAPEVQSTFQVSLRKHERPIPAGFPFLHSTVAAQQGTEMLFIGGRIAGFHGISQEQEPFKTTKANQSIWTVDFTDLSFSELPLGLIYPDLIQFKGSSFLSYQDQDTLFIAGGYGPTDANAEESNTTYDQIIAIQVSRMIEEVKKGSAGNPRNAILKQTNTPLVQVAGGEMIRDNGIFYVLFGQNYQGSYVLSLSGEYTNSVRQFRWDGMAITDTASVTAANLRRRDLNVLRVEQRAGPLFVGYAGVFNKDDSGYSHPIYVRPNVNGQLEARENHDISQKTNSYKAAVASIYDAVLDRNTHVIMGGIGQFQYHPQTGQWEEGDNGAPLPFVKSITQMIWQNGVLTQYIQLPPAAAELPELLGANALFIPFPALQYSPGVIDYNKLSAGESSIGWFYGGIKSQKPTSNMIYPTSINSTLYEVILQKVSEE